MSSDLRYLISDIWPLTSDLPLHPSDRPHRVFDALGVGLPEGAELGLIEIVDVLADVCHRVKSRILVTIGSGVPLGANRPTHR